MPTSVDIEVVVDEEDEGDDTVWFCFDLPVAMPGMVNASTVFQFEVPDARAFLADAGVSIDRFLTEESAKAWLKKQKEEGSNG